MHDESSTTGPAPPADPPAVEATTTQQPWIRFAVSFAVLVGISEVVYHGLALESEIFKTFLRGLARVAGGLLGVFDGDVTVSHFNISTGNFVVSVDYGCDGIQICTLLSCAIIAFPSTIRQKLVGLVLGNLWLQAWNVVRIASLAVIGGVKSEFFEPTHVYIWPTILILICLMTWTAWAHWTLRDDERRESPPEPSAIGSEATEAPASAKKPLQSFVLHVAFLALLLGVLPSIDSAYAYLFTTAGNAAFGSFGSELGVEYRWMPPRERHDRGEVRMRGQGADQTVFWESSYSVRDRGYLPTVVLIALVLATPARSRARTAAAAFAGVILLNLFFLIQTGFLAATLFAATSESLMPLGGWLAAGLPITKAFFGSPVIRYVAVFAAWILCTKPAAGIDFGALGALFRRLTPPGPRPRA